MEKTRKDISQRITELRKQNKQAGFGELYTTLYKEGYKPEEIMMWLGEFLAFS